MSTDAARLVYILQHCSPRVRKILEHFFQNLNLGYRLAYASFSNDYGQPHFVAYMCKKRLLSSPVLKSIDLGGLKAFAVLMKMSSVLLQDFGNFASLNTAITVTQKLSVEIRKRWIKLTFKFLKQTKYHAKFIRLMQFVKNKAKGVSSLYGKAFSQKEKNMNLSR